MTPSHVPNPLIRAELQHNGAKLSLGTKGAASQLDEAERGQLERLESIIQTAHRYVLKLATALSAIREQRLYRATHRTFEDYCAQRWGFSREHGRRYCDWAKVAQNLTVNGAPIGGKLPLRESHARPLARLTPDQQRKVWGNYVAKSTTPPSAKAIERIVRQVASLSESSVRSSPVPETLPQQSGQIIHGDVLDVLPTLSDRSVACVVTSPPYAEQRNGHYPGKPEKEYPNWMTSVMRALRPKLAPDASVLIVIRPHVRDGVISDYVLRTRLALRDDGWCEIDEYVWQKPDGGALGHKHRLRRAWESILHFAPSNDPYADGQRTLRRFLRRLRRGSPGPEACFRSGRA